MEFILYTFLYALLFYVTGYLILKLCRIEILDPYAQLFASNIIGTVFIVWTIAFIRTQGITVMNAVWIPATGIAVYLHKNKLWFRGSFKVQFSLHLSHIIWALCLFALIIINYVFYMGYSVSHPAVGNVDTIYYVRLSEFIYYTGIESTNIDYLQLKSNSPNPYHYFTPWMQAGFNAFFSVENNYLVRKTVVFSIYFANIYIGLIAVLKTLVKKNELRWYHYILPLFFFFIKPVGFGTLTAKIFGSYALYWINSLIQLPKYSPIVMVLLACVLLVQYKHYTVSAILLLLLPIFYITTTPVVCLITSCIVLWAWIKKRRVLYSLPFIALILGGYFILFYGFHPKQNYVVNPSGNTSAFWERFSDMRFLKVFFHDASQMIFVWILSLSLFIVLSLLFYRDIKQHILGLKNIYVLVIFLTISFPVSFLVWQILYYISDSEQFMASFISPVYMIFVFLWVNLLIELLMEKRKKWIIGFTGIYALILIYSAFHASSSEIRYYKKEYSPEYIQYIQKNKKRFSQYGAILIDNKYIWYLYFHGFPKPYIQNKNPRDFFALNICELKSIDESYDLDKLYIPLFPFYQYVEKQKAENTFSSLSQSKLDFIRKYHINHMVVTKGVVIDSIFLPYIKEKYTDSYSGEQLYFIDVPQK